MRTILKVSMPVEKANQAIKDGSLPRTMTGFMDEHKPEAAYFYAENGQRTALFVFDLKDPAQMPSVSERFFMSLNADVTFSPVMNAADLKKGLEMLATAKAVA
jgi:hypothetical protein